MPSQWMIGRDSINRNTERYIECGMFELIMIFITLLTLHSVKHVSSMKQIMIISISEG